ncbi:MAG: alkyldihydroxyacetonephosphate synthase, partial [Myxococcota bacterium]
FATLTDGLDAIRRIIREGWRPTVVRLYDAAESRRQFDAWCPDGRCILLLLHEGPAGMVDAQSDGCATLCETTGTPTNAAAVDCWLAVRNHVPTLGQLSAIGLVVDTIEVSAAWSRIGAVYDSVTASLSEVPEMVAVSAHASHAYRSGVNLYFTFVAQPAEREAMERIYTECWRRTMVATAAAGGGISHHHGIGRVRRDFMPQELGAVGVDVLRRLKAALDPDGLLNPGVLIP